jgi:hypothetical protein
MVHRQNKWFSVRTIRKLINKLWGQNAELLELNLEVHKIIIRIFKRVENTIELQTNTFRGEMHPPKKVIPTHPSLWPF